MVYFMVVWTTTVPLRASIAITQLIFEKITVLLWSRNNEGVRNSHVKAHEISTSDYHEGFGLENNLNLPPSILP